MASPPFSLSTSTPGDSDIVSQFPLDERTLRDIIQSWLLIDHNNLGNHVKVTMPWVSPPATPLASTNAYYTNPDGNLAVIDPTGSARYVGPPVGSVFFHSTASPPVGYLIADGSAVSRATFSALFSVIGITYGAGNGSTTFNLPNITGRVIAGVDSGGVNLSATGLGTAAVLTAVGGAQTHLLTTAEIPSHTHGNSLNDLGHTHPGGQANSAGNVGGVGVASGVPQYFTTALQGVTNASAPMSITNAAAGGGGTHTIVQPTIILLPIIKY